MADESGKRTTYIDAKRRGFLQGTVLATGAVAGGGALAIEPGDEPLVPDTGAKAQAGYRETDHVRAYYAAARN